MSAGRKTLNLSECRVVGSSAGRSRLAPPCVATSLLNITIFLNKLMNMPYSQTLTNPVMPSVHGTFLWDAGPSKHQSEHLFFIGLF